MSRTIIIAEAGVNHNGDINLALELVNAAHKAGADIVKFQTFVANKVATANAHLARYQKDNCSSSKNQRTLLSKLELSYDEYYRIYKHCNQVGIEFLSTAFDTDSLTFLVEQAGLKRLKIPSGEITNAPFLLEHARTGLDIILSTGMSSLAEIEDALGVIAYGYLSPTAPHLSRDAFQQAYSSIAGQQLLKKKVAILHCTTEYPAPLSDINLRAVDTLAAAFGLSVGYSDHSEGISVPIGAAARGAHIIEKHITLDRDMEGPDHKSSLAPNDFQGMVQAIRDIETALGNTIKAPQMSELHNRELVRRSIVAKQLIKSGDVFTPANIEVKRPGGGMSPFSFWQLQSVLATQDYQIGDFILENHHP